MLSLEALENCKPIRKGHPCDVKKFADLLDIAITNLKETRRVEELGNGTFYRKLQRKMPERMVAQCQRWIFENHEEENVESLRTFIIQEAELQTEAAETIHGLHKTGYTKSKNSNDQTFIGSNESNKQRKAERKCIVCEGSHPIWSCDQYKGYDVKRRWPTAKCEKLCYRCLGGNQITDGEKSPVNRNSYTTTMKTQEVRNADSIALRTVPVVLKNGKKRMMELQRHM